MQIFKNLIVKFSRSIDFIAGLILAATALLIVTNILGRALLNRPILGTYEMVGYLTAAAIGLALARCAVENSHIAISFFTDRLPLRVQPLIEAIVGLPVFVFLCFTTYHLIIFGNRVAASGEVAPTTQYIFYPIIYILALGFFVLGLTVLLKLLQLLRRGEQL